MAWPPPAAPGALSVLMEMLGQCGPTPELDFGELFAGAGAVHRHLQDLGYRGRAMDQVYCKGHDILQPLGMLAAIRIACSIKPGGLLWLAPPCSTWVWLTRGSTGRSLTALGDFTLPAVIEQNALVERVMLLCELVHRRGGHYIIEQPASSVLWSYPAVAQMLKRHGLQGPTVLDFGAYGGSSIKPTHLWGTAPYLAQLSRRCTAADKVRLEAEGVQTTNRYVDNAGRKRCQGTSDLKGTQAYPENWGVAHAHAFAKHYGESQAHGTIEALEHQVHLAAVAAALPGLQDAWWLRDF